MIDAVESAWRELLQTAREPWELHFSRCTEPRYTWDIPYVAPSYDGRYRVDGPARSESVGEAGSVGEALAMVIERLPPGCGPAFVGTPQELAGWRGDWGGARSGGG
ncbi:DUF6193 family natural product biosynthesis protein [Streptomyces sp. NPDC001700]